MSPLHKKENFTQLIAPPDGLAAAFDMVFVGRGAFRMGIEKEDPDAYGDEQPVHDVSVSDFFIGKYPVTQALWKAVMGDGNPSFLRATSGR